jgi:hypothetical protein
MEKKNYQKLEMTVYELHHSLLLLTDGVSDGGPGGSQARRFDGDWDDEK